MKKHLGVFFISALLQGISYTNLTINFRAIAAGHIPFAMVTGALATLLAYTLVRRMTRAEGPVTVAGMMVGGALAEALGIWLTRHWQ